MGGLKKDLPITYWTFLVGAVAIAGVPGLAGFFSKDDILFRTYEGGHTVLWVVGLLTSLLTAIYMFRLVFLAFHGERAQPMPHDAAAAPHPAPGHAVSDDVASLVGAQAHAAGHHLHDAPPAMAVALIVLAIGSAFAGYLGLPHALGGSNRLEQFLEPSFTAGEGAVVALRNLPLPPSGEDASGASEALELGLMGVSSVVAVGGIGIAMFLFLKNRRAADAIAARFEGLHRLLVHKYYVDELYDAAIINPIRIVAEDGLWKGVDVRVIDGSVNGVAAVVAGGSQLLRRIQTGSVRGYAVSVFLGVVAILGFYLWN
jgi:NADH-quinone oxidoreductase subunit L